MGKGLGDSGGGWSEGEERAVLLTAIRSSTYSSSAAALSISEKAQ